MNEEEQILLKAAEADHEYVIGLRRYFHENPETAREEFGTQKKIEEELDKIGVFHQRIAGTGVLSQITGTRPFGDEKGRGAENPRQIVLRADIDALPIQEESGAPYASHVPGKMHACGHDAHCASLIGAARLLQAHRDLFSGTVRLTWQPGEEIGYGARVIIDEGGLEGCTRSFGLHLASNVQAGKIAITPGPNNASVDWFCIKVHGLGAHISEPEHGIDAAYIASQIVIGAQALVTRRTSPMDNVLIGIGKVTAGTAYNVVAQEAQIEGTVRVFRPEIRAQVRKELTDLAVRTAQIYGGTAQAEWKDFTSPLINPDGPTAEVQQTARAIFGPENVITNRIPALSGDDMAEYMLKVPGCYGYVGSGNPDLPNTCVAHHNAHFDIDEKCLLTGAAMYACYAADYQNGVFEDEKQNP